MAPVKHNVFQQVFGLSLASNLVRACTGTATDLQNRFKDALPAALQVVGVDWKVVWGPVVWKASGDQDPTTNQDNAWFVARNDSVDFGDGILRSTYVVAIAGTASTYSWIIQDLLGVLRAVDIDSWAGSGPDSLSKVPPSIPNNGSTPLNVALVSQGFAGGVFNLVNTRPLPGFPGDGQTLPQFLLKVNVISSTSQPAPKIVFTGHSLGGALSPILAYALHKANALGPFKLENVLVYSTAAPTPGNAWFAKKFKDYFPSPIGTLQGYRYWNCNIVCRLDVVPCAFCADPSYYPLVLDRILTMYGDAYPNQVWSGLIAMKLAAKRLFYPITASFFESKFPKPSNPILDFGKWMQQAHLQHTDPYTWEILSMDTLSGLCHDSEQDGLKTYPVLGSIVDAADKTPPDDRVQAEDAIRRMLNQEGVTVVAA
ncbi:hypothetical protein FRC07_006410 [Ceratobasidium sp. 392]|nr:hypothetical protein FRC07_006410 [Ceratobasidium sp. 392]